MNYYERHLGDYARDTVHLSMLEHGAYTLLMDRYYATEGGIPAEQAYRLARARTKDERAAVDTILSEFFSLVEGVWVQDRIDGEIDKARARIDAARGNGKKGGRPKKGNPKANPEKPSGLGLGSVSITQKKALQTPPIHHTEPNGSGADAPMAVAPDPIWGTGLAFLVRKGIPEKPARGLLGQLRKAAGDVQVGSILSEAEAQDISDPAPWLMAAASKAKASNSSGVGNGQDRKLSASEQTRAAIASRRAASTGGAGG